MKGEGGLPPAVSSVDPSRGLLEGGWRLVLMPSFPTTPCAHPYGPARSGMLPSGRECWPPGQHVRAQWAGGPCSGHTGEPQLPFLC